MFDRSYGHIGNEISRAEYSTSSKVENHDEADEGAPDATGTGGMWAGMMLKTFIKTDTHR